ncbi:MAG: cytochrome c3 family protein [Nitrospiraceae bacterium]|nr:cytochrome c3 family protein [Nitrospiraceae bacterium]
MLRTITILSLVVMLVSCGRWNMDKKEKAAVEESPLISSLKDAGLPCFTCHPYETFRANKKSGFSHAKHLGFGVHCNQCHLIRPHREMALNKDTCNNCHNLTRFTYTVSGMPVTFSHQGHAKRYNCGECHSGLFQMKKGTSRMVMDDMFKGGSCGKCHNGKTAFSARDCAKCHTITAMKKDLVYKSKDMTPAVFSHQVHTSMFDCNKCHPSLFTFKKGGSDMNMNALYQARFCGACHNGQSAFSTSECQRCHK